MRYLGIDVHVSTTVWCLLNETGEVVANGKVPTTQEGLSRLLSELGGPRDLVIGQEVGTMTAFVQDVLVAYGADIKSFNAHHLRMIASSRKKTDRRDAYWIARALQTGMTPIRFRSPREKSGSFDGCYRDGRPSWTTAVGGCCVRGPTCMPPGSSRGWVVRRGRCSSGRWRARPESTPTCTMR